MAHFSHRAFTVPGKRGKREKTTLLSAVTTTGRVNQISFVYCCVENKLVQSNKSFWSVQKCVNLKECQNSMLFYYGVSGYGVKVAFLSNQLLAKINSSL